MRISLLSVFMLALLPVFSIAQSALDSGTHYIHVKDFNSESFQRFFQPKIDSTQFILVGEQHGLAEVGELTAMLYQLAAPLGYRTLCLETDAIAAAKLAELAEEKDAIAAATQFENEFPLSIPFYSNKDDYALLQSVAKGGGNIWGIDQTLMTGFRLNLHWLATHTKNKAFRKRLNDLHQQAKEAFQTTMETKDFMAPFIFKYTNELHQELWQMAETATEREVLLQLQKTREIYQFNFERKTYANNYARSQWLIRNFMRYLNQAKSKAGEYPKVLFKMGANHTGRGLSAVNVYDVGQVAATLATTIEKESLHVKVIGVEGMQLLGNPFAPEPIQAFKHIADFPDELKPLLEIHPDQHLVVDLAALRPNAKQYSAALQAVMFQHDVLVLVRNATALTPLKAK